MNQSLPSRAFREHTDLDQLKRQARELLEAVRCGDVTAITEVKAHYRAVDSPTFALHDAQLVLARAYGFDSWPKLKACVDGITVKRLRQAARVNDLEEAQAVLRRRPELVNMGVGGDEHHAIHDAVLNRSPEMTRLLMQYGADARSGIHPHREATTAFTLAAERGYADIVAVIHEEERHRREIHAGIGATSTPETLFWVETWQSGRALEILRADPTLVQSTSPDGATPLHAAACALHRDGTVWLLDQVSPRSELQGSLKGPVEPSVMRITVDCIRSSGLLRFRDQPRRPPAPRTIRVAGAGRRAPRAARRAAAGPARDTASDTFRDDQRRRAPGRPGVVHVRTIP